MKTFVWFVIWTALASGCATDSRTVAAHDEYVEHAARYKLLAAQPGPKSWRADASWTFTLLNKKGAIVNSLDFQVTAEPANTCSSGEWKKLRVVRQSTLMTHNPAYSIEGRNLQILLSTALCDSYDELSGELDEHGFVGVHRFSGMRGGEEYGKVLGSPTH